MKKVKMVEIQEMIMADKVTKLPNGNYKAYYGFFYTHGQTSEKKSETIKSTIPDVNIIKHGEHWASFKGGAPVQKQSHFYVEFNLNTK